MSHWSGRGRARTKAFSDAALSALSIAEATLKRSDPVSGIDYLRTTTSVPFEEFACNAAPSEHRGVSYFWAYLPRCCCWPGDPLFFSSAQPAAKGGGVGRYFFSVIRFCGAAVAPAVGFCGKDLLLILPLWRARLIALCRSLAALLGSPPWTFIVVRIEAKPEDQNEACRASCGGLRMLSLILTAWRGQKMRLSRRRAAAASSPFNTSDQRRLATGARLGSDDAPDGEDAIPLPRLLKRGSPDRVVRDTTALSRREEFVRPRSLRTSKSRRQRPRRIVGFEVRRHPISVAR